MRAMRAMPRGSTCAQAFAAQMCPLADAAGALLLREVEAGGQRARVAAACIVAAIHPGACANETARAAARDSFVQAMADLGHPGRQLGWVGLLQL